MGHINNYVVFLSGDFQTNSFWWIYIQYIYVYIYMGEFLVSIQVIDEH